MSHEIFMPALSSTMTEGKIVEWLKNPGDKVERGESVLVVESDKADMDVESFQDGYLAAVLMPAGSTAPVGETIGIIVENENDIASVQEQNKVNKPEVSNSDQVDLASKKTEEKPKINNKSNKKELLKLVENLIDLMPVELRTARFIVREQELYLKKAKDEAEEILANADKESSRLISESFVLQEAVVEANALVKQAEQEAILNRANVEDKLDTKLQEIQLKFDELNEIIEREKSNLRQPRKISDPE